MPYYFYFEVHSRRIDGKIVRHRKSSGPRGPRGDQPPPIPLAVDQRSHLVIHDRRGCGAMSVLAVAVPMFVPEGQPSCGDAKDKR